MTLTNPPARVLHLLPTFQDRGGQRIALWIAAGLDRARFAPFAASLRTGGAAAARFDACGVPTASFGARRRLFLDPHAAGRLVSFLRAQRIQVLHTHGVRDGIYGRICGRLAGCPVIVSSIHNKWGSLAHHVLDGATMRLADLVLPFSRTAAQFAYEALRVPRAKVRVVYFGIETERFSRVPASVREGQRRALGVGPDRILVGSVAALTDQKGFDFLIEALPTVLAANPSCLFAIAGEGERRAALEARARSLGVAGSISFIGSVEDTPSFLAALDLFVLPSRWEGLPIAAVEAMAAGRPVLLSRVDGNTEVVHDGVTGYLVEPCSAPALASRLVEVLDAPAEARARVAAQGRSLAVERFARQRMVAEFSEVYESLLETRGCRPSRATPSSAAATG